MKTGQISELRLRNFRCFHQQQAARMAPLTLLVGDNSTGKTSFLAAVRAIWDAVYQKIEPDFRASPYDLGAFPEIVYRDGDDEARSDSFEIGFSGSGRRRRFDADMKFETRAAAPFPARISVTTKKAWIRYAHRDNERPLVEFGTEDDSWSVRFDRTYPTDISALRLLRFFMSSLRILDDAEFDIEKLSGSVDTPDSDTIRNILSILREFSIPTERRNPFASAPIRSSPHRTYDPIRLLPDPEGAYIPTYLANVNFRYKAQWNRLKESLEKFGRMSGLFHEIVVKQLGDMEGGPFQLEIKIGDIRESRRRRNLIDVGYGVSQVLPVLTEIIRPDAPPIILFQQPEVHLHPSAQAALGSLFCSAAASGRQLVIETHSDYIIDRVLLDIRDRRTDLKADDVSILYFERGDSDVTIHSIRIDAEGNILNAPAGYRKFFQDELNRVIDY